MSQRLWGNIKLNPKSFSKGIEEGLDRKDFDDALKSKLKENDREHIIDYLREEDYKEIYLAYRGMMEGGEPTATPVKKGLPIELEKQFMQAPIQKPTQAQIYRRLEFNKKITKRKGKIGIKIKGRTKYYSQKNLVFSDFQRKRQKTKVSTNAYSIYNKKTKKLVTWQYF